MAEEKNEGTVQVTQENLVSVVQNLVDAVPLILDEIKKLQTTTVKKSAGLFGGKRTKTAIKDTTTGKVYPSKAAVGKMLGKEFGCAPDDNFAWYKIIAKAPDRFKDASAEEAEAAWKKQDEESQKAVDEANKKLAAEEAAKKATERKGGKK